MPDRVDLKVTRGDTSPFVLYFTDSTGAVIDITGYTVWLTVKENISDLDASAKIQKKVTSHTDPTNGVTTITLSAAETELLATNTAIGHYIYDIQAKTAAGLIYTVMMGSFSVESDVTRSTT